MQTDTLAYDTMSQDTLPQDTIDSLDSRPLPKWLVDQKSGHTAIQPEKIVMREENSLKISFVVTGIFILVIVSVFTLYFIRKHKKQSQ